MKRRWILVIGIVMGINGLTAWGEQASPSTSSATNASVRMPEVTVTEQLLNEEKTVGPNQQPEWTTQRRFPTTRVYVLAPWQVEFEQWWKGKFPRDGHSSHLFQEEIGVGLPYRFQLDVYENLEYTDKELFRHQGNQVEIRWALADWGRIPLNPTLYAEWVFNDHDPDKYELKLLLGEELAPRWHWALNGIYEQEVGGGRSTELAWSQAVSYTVIDQKLSVGVEMNFEHTTEKGSRSDPEIEFIIGPCFQWRPTCNTHLDAVPLFGVTHESPRVEVFIVFGIDFGPGAKAESGMAPISTRTK